ncbi:MAG: D-aminoacyl-tRNA deacylase [Marinilabiliales bacterium]|nr:D-aminoacyl-tRNA deacylase [Marinilabiliales bacterium]
MRTLVQRVTKASVTIDGNLFSSIGEGLLVLAGFEAEETETDLEWSAAKLVTLRIFNDEAGVMNRSVLETGGDILIVSQFTLHASTRRGNRPSYIRAAPPEISKPLYHTFVQKVEKLLGKGVGTGIFGADMKVELLNDGPVTLLIDSRNRE